MNSYTNIIISHALALPTTILMIGLCISALGIPFAPIMLASEYGFIGIAYFGLYLLSWIICAAITVCLAWWYDFHTDDFNPIASALVQVVICMTIIAAIGA